MAALNSRSADTPFIRKRVNSSAIDDLECESPIKPRLQQFSRFQKMKSNVSYNQAKEALEAIQEFD